MNKNWVVLRSSSNFIEISLMRGLLESHQIASIILNKQDSAYLAFGLIELHVKSEDFLRANHIINKEAGEQSDS
ncbi:MAG: DUF2007 domain-containing protein [Bacteroidota bacterium]